VVINDLLKEVQSGVVHATKDGGQPLCGNLTRWRTITSSWIADDSETTCAPCRQDLGLPPAAVIRSHARGPVPLVMVGDEMTGTVWVPVWLVWDRPDLLWWINEDSSLHATTTSLTDSRNLFRVPRWKWAQHMELAA
jgi:hypothetical protein